MQGRSKNQGKRKAAPFGNKEVNRIILKGGKRNILSQHTCSCEEL